MKSKLFQKGLPVMSVGLLIGGAMLIWGNEMIGAWAVVVSGGILILLRVYDIVSNRENNL